MSKKKFSVYVDPMFPVQIIPYMFKDEEMEQYTPGTVNECKELALQKLEEVYNKNREKILAFTEKSNAF